MACVPGSARVDPKAVRAHLPEGWKRLHFASAEEIETVTGCVMGAVSPLGLPDDIPVIFDETIAGFENVNISSGDPMMGLELAAVDLIAAAGAELAPVVDVRK
jgi:prolyl-tRNA editing enzyme YbaK/EbsC (Cys-tRNA(Pro) deacylase)